VDAGVSELERWLADQVRAGLAAAGRADYRHWDSMAARLVDAKAPGLAGSVRRLASVAGAPERLFTEVSLLWLLVRAYRRLAELPPGLAETVRSRIGFPVATADVLAGPRVRDEWAVLGVRDEIDERLTVRRVWLRGRSGQYALVLSFAAPGQSLPADLVPGTSIDASLCFYPGARPLRAPHGLSTVRALGRGQVGAAMTPWATLLAAAGAARPLPFARRAAAAGRGGRWGSGALAGRAESGVDILHPGVEETADPSAWETGSPAQRRGYLATLRRQDPAAARARLTDGWATLAATERADLLQTLAIGLGPDDEPLLQSALDDRRKEVRVVAADLLTVLPGSAYQERAIARARHHLVVDGTRVDVRLPARGRPRRLP
ncbi:MAG: SWIM zinc finger family protein, partial [Micromonosporaceae bacterium]|nr:SWIM zinc finger family protein [Micromonosporaceae bacterium]